MFSSETCVLEENANHGQTRYRYEVQALSEACSAYKRRAGRYKASSYRDWVKSEEGRAVRLAARDRFYADHPTANRVVNSTIEPVTNQGRPPKRNSDRPDPTEPDSNRPRTSSPVPGSSSFDFDNVDFSVGSVDLSAIEPSEPDISTSVQSVRSDSIMDATTSNPVATNLAADSPGQSISSGGGPAIGSVGPTVFPRSSSKVQEEKYNCIEKPIFSAVWFR